MRCMHHLSLRNDWSCPNKGSRPLLPAADMPMRQRTLPDADEIGLRVTAHQRRSRGFQYPHPAGATAPSSAPQRQATHHGPPPVQIARFPPHSERPLSDLPDPAWSSPLRSAFANRDKGRFAADNRWNGEQLVREKQTIGGADGPFRQHHSFCEGRGERRLLRGGPPPQSVKGEG